MIFTDDLVAFLTELNRSQVEYMIIGGAAVNIHGFSRATGDMDIGSTQHRKILIDFFTL